MSSSHHLAAYLQELREIRSSGAAVKETSYYPAISNLLNEIGKTLKPRVRCVLTLQNRGAGNPDGGLFTVDQFQKTSDAEHRALDTAHDLAITVGWGHARKEGVTMPGKGKLIARDYTPEERAGLDLTPQLGATTCDIYLNEAAYWRNIPSRVWGYVIGGYQVIKKWLSYRERDLLKRSLTPEEAHEVTNMARRIAAILLLEPALDANYQAAKESPFAWWV